MSTASAASTLAGAGPDAPSPVTFGARGLVLVIALVALADWLFYKQVPGLALVVFNFALAAGALAANPVRSGRGATALGACALLAGLLPYAVNPSLLSFLFSVAAIVAFAALLFASSGPAVSDIAGAALSLLLNWFRAPIEMSKAIITVGGKRPRSLAPTLAMWFVPVTLGAVFASLFVSANPLIDGWVSAIDLRAIFRWVGEQIDGWRIAFWLMVSLLIWPVIFVREYRRRATRERPQIPADASTAGPVSALLGRAEILRSLIVFNSLFAVQTILDAIYLWGGVALPDGMTYAQYAHRGAYSLIAAALLAAAFVIVALKPGSNTERTPLIRVLVCLWIAQTVWLVISSMLRLDLYVAAYSLTYFRVAAFVWMLLVAVGLVLILARIGLGRSNGWLIGANLVSLTLTLYACAFINFAGIIAHYNVAHSEEMGGGGPTLDRVYLRALGAQAIPAMDIFISRIHFPAGDSRSYLLPTWRDYEAEALRTTMQDWRTWSYWDWRLLGYLAQTAATPLEGP
jgi:MFS family permease